jgi:hypothetical protein
MGGFHIVLYEPETDCLGGTPPPIVTVKMKQKKLHTTMICLSKMSAVQVAPRNVSLMRVDWLMIGFIDDPPLTLCFHSFSQHCFRFVQLYEPDIESKTSRIRAMGHE